MDKSFVDRMKISEVEIFPIHIPFLRPHKIALGSAGGRDILLVQIKTDNGLVGYGEAIAHPAFSGESLGTLKASVNSLGKYIIGESPLNINKISYLMEAKLYGNYGAKGAIETALFDIMGKYFESPVSYLLGGVTTDRLSLSRSASHSDIEKDIAEVKEYLNEGYHVIKIKVGVLPVYEDVERVKAIRDLVGAGVSLRADANQGWDVPTALKFIKGVEDCGLEFLEQPICKSNLDGMSYLRSKSSTPIMADEAAATEHDVLEIIKKQAADFISIKLVKAGGMLAARRIAFIANCAGIKCYLGSQTETSIGTAAGIHYALSSSCFEYGGETYGPAFYTKDIVKKPVKIEKGYIYLPEGPGFGMDLDMDIVQEFAVEDF